MITEKEGKRKRVFLSWRRENATDDKINLSNRLSSGQIISTASLSMTFMEDDSLQKRLGSKNSGL